MEQDGNIHTVNINFINSIAKSQGIISKLKTSSYQNSAKISYKVDTDSNSNILPFHLYKSHFPRSTKSYCHESKVKTLSSNIQ